jgi:hypothetical protein
MRSRKRKNIEDNRGQHEKGNKAIWPKLFTGGMAIAWFLSASTNGVFNFLSESPAFQLYPFCIALCVSAFYVIATMGLKRAWLLAFVWGPGCAALLFFTESCVQQKKKMIAARDIDGNPTGLLVPQTRTLSTNAPQGAVLMTCGSVSLYSVSGSRISLVAFDGEPFLTLGIDSEHRRAYLSGKFCDERGDVVALISTNVWKLNRNKYLTKSLSPDESTLEVRDQQNTEVLNLRFLAPNEFSLQGLIRLPYGIEMAITPTKVVVNSFGKTQAVFSNFSFRGSGALFSIHKDGHVCCLCGRLGP